MASPADVSSANNIVHELLNMDNYEHWSLRVKTYLLAEGLWKVVEATGDPPKLEDDEEWFHAWRKQNAKALHVIHISCGSRIFSLISDTTSAREAWVLLAKMFKIDFPDETADLARPVDGAARSVNDNNIQEEATDAHDNMSENIIALQEALDNDRYDDWDTLMEILNIQPELVRIRGPRTGYTALHKAVKQGKAKELKEMLQLMKKEDLKIQDRLGLTAFSYAVRMQLAKIEIVECLVRKNEALVSIWIPFFAYQEITPIVAAAINNNWEVANYLYRFTPKEALNGRHGADLITTCIDRKQFDIPWDLVQRYPNLATTRDATGDCPLILLASTPSAFLSGTPLGFWQRWIYHCIRIEDDFIGFDACTEVRAPVIDEENQTDLIESGVHTEDDFAGLDGCIIVQRPEIDEGNQTDRVELVGTSSGSAMERHAKLPFWQHIQTYCNAVPTFFKELSVDLLKLLGIFHRIYEMKLVHVRVRQLLIAMSQVTSCSITHLNDSEVQRAIFQAVQRGHVEFVEVLVLQNQYADALNITDRRGRNVFFFAIECRQEKVYNSICQHPPESFIDAMGDRTDYFNNNLLHIVGSLSSSVQFDHIRDAALQMQRELQWFEEVANFVSTNMQEIRNFADGMTGRELFSKNHKELVKEGEKSMKETATSCTVVGALIITIMFAAAFTVGGGNDGSTGLPVFLDDRLFMVFIVSDALSLFSSTTSVMIFLGILTSRYAENDFLKSLPTKMMVGLLTLFFSIATMMVAFSTTLMLMLHEKYPWIVVPIIVLACVPITAFVWMQSPLLVEICVSTYGPGIFRKRRSRSRRHKLKMFYERIKRNVARTVTPTLKDKV